MTLQNILKPSFKTNDTLEQEANSWLLCYKPTYVDDLNKKLDLYEFIFEFLPDYFKKQCSDNLKVDFFKSEIQDNENNQIIGFTEPRRILFNQKYFDSKDEIENKIFNFATAHEAYHYIAHRSFLRSQENQLSLFDNSIQTPKLNKIITLKNDLSSASNLFCVQANKFAGYFTMPKKRLQKTLLELTGKDHILINKKEMLFQNDELEIYKDIATKIANFFEVNITPVAIALKKYNLIRFKPEFKESKLF